MLFRSKFTEEGGVSLITEYDNGVLTLVVEDTGTGMTEEGREIQKVYFLENKDHAEDHFTLDPRDQMNAIKDMRANGLKPLGNWHSHPSSPSRPSVEDIRLAFDSKASYLILSLMAEYPVLNSFHVESGVWEKEDLRIYSEEYFF